jgi:tripeptide aminopeptidase
MESSVTLLFIMKTQVKVNSEKLLQTFLELVRIDSPSGAEGPVREYIANRLDQLGLTYDTDAAGNLIVKIPGEHCESGLTLIMTGHMDVVPPCLGIEPIVEGKGEDCLIRSSGNTVLGADDKSGLAPMLEALELSLEHKLPRPNLIFLITTREEVMLQGAKEMDEQRYREADFAIALDHTGRQGTLIHEAPTYIKFKMTVHGKSVHAGIMPEKGINAIQILSWVLEKIEFGRLDENTTSNIGFIKGGKATNIVPDLAVADGEIRGHDETRLQNQLALIEKVLHDVVDPIEGASYELDSEVCFRHYLTDPQDHRVQRVVRAMESLELPVNMIRTNGGSDVNIFAERGIPGIVLSAGYMEPHSLNERVPLRDMITCTQLMLSIWEAFAES